MGRAHRCARGLPAPPDTQGRRHRAQNAARSAACDERRPRRGIGAPAKPSSAPAHSPRGTTSPAIVLRMGVKTMDARIRKAPFAMVVSCRPYTCARAPRALTSVRSRQNPVVVSCRPYTCAPTTRTLAAPPEGARRGLPRRRERATATGRYTAAQERSLWPGAPGRAAASCARAARCASRRAAPSGARARSARSASGGAGGCPTASPADAGCARGRAAGRAAHHDCVCCERPGAQLGAGNVHVARGHVEPARERPPHGRQARPHRGAPPPRRGPRAPLQHFSVRQLRARMRAGIRSAARQHQRTERPMRARECAEPAQQPCMRARARTHAPQRPPHSSARRATALRRLLPRARRAGAASPRPARPPSPRPCSSCAAPVQRARAGAEPGGLRV